VFLAAADAQLDPVRFEPDFVGSLSFSALPGTAESLDALRAAGLALACVANWDSSLAGFLEDAGVADRFDAIVSAAEAGALKPDPRVFELALDRLGVLPSRALHIGDDAADRDGASAAGLAFEPVPLATLPARLGLAPP
jgi:putative hydrolase of the HAD superfamily